MPISPVITSVGLAAVLNATNDGLAARIRHIALGDGAWIPDASATALQNERHRIDISNGERIQPNQIHLTAIENGDVEYWIREIGFILDDGTLLAVWSHENQPLAYKAAGVDVLLAFDLVLSALPDDSVEVIGTGGVNLPPATETIMGVVRFATEDEALAGVLDNVAMTPAGVQAHGDERFAQKVHRHRWTNIDERPSEFPPTAHTHPWTEVTGKPSSFPPSNHTHTWSEVTSKPSTYPPSNHSHSWSEVTNKPTAFPPASHNHNWNDIESKPTTFPPSSHSHAWSSITGKPSSFPPESHTHTWNAVTDKPSTFPPANHDHTWNSIQSKPSSFPPAFHHHDDRNDTRYSALNHNHDTRYVVLNDFRVTSGFTMTLNRFSGVDWEGYNDWTRNYALISPPIGFTTFHLMGFIATPAVLYFGGDVGSDDTLYCRWRIETPDNQVRVICANSENRGDNAGAASYIRYLAIWRRF